MKLEDFQITLASTSPRRKDLLKTLGVDFNILAPDFEEVIKAGEDPLEYVKRNAKGKAQSVLSLVSHDDKKISLMIGADTIVCIDHKVLEKPKDKNEAADMLRKLSGRTHEVYTGIALFWIKGGKTHCVQDVFKTEVTFKKLSGEEIMSYVNTGEPLDKAGAYGIQGKAAYFISSIDGSYTNVIGLPLSGVYEKIEQIT